MIKLNAAVKELTGYARTFTTDDLSGDIVWFSDNRYHVVNFADGAQSISFYGYAKTDWLEVLQSALEIRASALFVAEADRCSFCGADSDDDCLPTVKCRYCGAESGVGVCDACDDAHVAQAMDEAGRAAALIVSADADSCPACYGSGYVSDGDDAAPCDHPDCTYRWPERPATAAVALNPSWSQVVSDYRERVIGHLTATTDELNRLMDQIDEGEAGPIPASEGATDQGDAYWIEATLAHLREVGLIVPASA